MTEKTQQTVRFAPSPTGLLHIGSVRSALFNYLYAKKNNAKLILRIEDTDKERSRKEFEDNIVEGFDWLGITFDEMYRQSERSDIYERYIQKLLDSGKAYISEEESGDRKHVIRFKNPNTSITFEDEVRGQVTFDTTELGDFVIARSETEPLYHLAVVIDDFEMGVTHVIRGEDHISNTPRQILILEAIGATRPVYAHIPMILAPDRSKMSKRHGTVAVTEYRAEGFLPEAILNYLALLGWNPGGDKEVFTLEELIELFDLSRVQKGGAIFSTEKLRWFNSEHLKLLSDDEKRAIMVDFLKDHKEVSDDFVSLVEESEPFRRAAFERIETLGDVVKFYKEGEYNYFFNEPQGVMDKVLRKDASPEKTKEHLLHLVKLLDPIEDFSDPEIIRSAVWDYATEQGRGDVLWPMRVALSGKERSIDPFTISVILGKIETTRRLEEVANKL